MPYTQKKQKKPTVVAIPLHKEQEQNSESRESSDEVLKEVTLRCISDMIEYFSHDPEVKRLWPNLSLTLKCLSLDLQKIQRDEHYQSHDFPMLNGKLYEMQH